MKSKKLVIFSILILTICLFMGLIGCNNDKNGNEEEQKKQEELAMAYEKQNTAFRLGNNQNMYMIMNYANLNPEGLSAVLYVEICYYNKETDNSFVYNQIVDYLSQEYEDDGEIRIYTNGRHPEIAEYVEWSWGHQEKLQEYKKELDKIYYDYYYATDGFETEPMYARSTEIIDELIKKEADPNYELDLIGIQQRQKAEA